VAFPEGSLRRQLLEMLLAQKLLYVAAGDTAGAQLIDGILSKLASDSEMRATLIKIRDSTVDLPLADEAARWLGRTTAQQGTPPSRRAFFQGFALRGAA